MADQKDVSTETPSNEAPTGPLTDDQAELAFMNSLTTEDADTPSEVDDEEEREEEDDQSTDEPDPADADDEEADDDEDEDTDPNAEEDADDTEDDDEHDADEDAAPVAGDDAEVEITVGEEKLKVPVKDLKRLYGQEAALTQRSQTLAQERKKLEVTASRTTTALQTMTKRAQERWAAYADIDMVQAARELGDEQFQTLRINAKQAHDDAKFYEQELDTEITAQREAHAETFKEAAQEALRVLNDPVEGIEGWNQQLYDEVRQHAVNTGMDPQVVNELVDPSAIKLIHDAMQYRKMKEAATAKKTKAKKKTPKRTRTSKTAPKGEDNSRDAKKAAALSRLRKSGGSDDAAEDAFLASL
ncbi:hypothetical protein [Pyruvatibacter sp.]